jgi:hypothetical protein
MSSPTVPVIPPAGPPNTRTTPELVAGIIEVDPGDDVSPFIYSANSVVTAVCGVADPPYSDGFFNSQMELIERWLSAHFYGIMNQQLLASKADVAAYHFQAKIDYGLKATMYGQQVMLLDNQSLLAALENTSEIKRKIHLDITHLGPASRWRSANKIGMANWFQWFNLNWPGFGGFPDITIEQ